MKKRLGRLGILFAIFGLAVAGEAPDGGRQALAPYKNPALSIERRAADLLSRMSLEEKFWQMFMIPGDLTLGKDRLRHGIFGLQIATAASSEGASGQMLRYGASGPA